MLKVHISKEKNIREIEAEGKLLDILAEAGSVVEEILLDSYKKQKREFPNISLEEYITPFFEVLKDSILKFHEEDEVEEEEIVVTKVKLNRDQATEIEKILESKNKTFPIYLRNYLMWLK